MHKFSPEHWARLESAERYALLQPESTLRRFGLAAGMTFLDVGAGTGFFTRAAAAIVGTTGSVYAADIAPELLGRIRSTVLPPQVQLILSEEHRIPLGDASADFTLLAFVCHETPDLRGFLREVRRVTKPAGHILLLEWKKQDEEHGPPEGERLAEDELVRQAGALFAQAEHASFNPSHYYALLSGPHDT